MQISRHWRLNSQRYRLQGTEFEDGSRSLQQRPIPVEAREDESAGYRSDTNRSEKTVALHRVAS